MEGAGGEAARVDLSDGSSFFLPTSIVEAEALAVGTILSEESLAPLQRAAEVFAARRKSLELLAASEQPRGRLALKLRLRGFGEEAIRAALDELAAAGELDDLRFARLWISVRARRNPCGRTALYAGLLSRGVSRRIAEEALANWGEEEEADAMHRAAERIAAKRGMDRERAVRALVRKGFSSQAVLHYFDNGEEND